MIPGPCENAIDKLARIFQTRHRQTDLKSGEGCDDDPGTLFGTFPRDQVFIVQVTLNINASAATAHTVLSGAGTSGQADYTIISALRPVARQFGAIRLMMGFPSTGRFDATTIVVTRNTE